MRDKAAYRAMSVDEIVALTDHEERREILETLIREHVSQANEKAIIDALERAIEDEDEFADLDKSDPDEYMTALLDRSTEDALATVLRDALVGAYKA